MMRVTQLAPACAALAGLWVLPVMAQNYRNPNPAPVAVPSQPVAPNAGAAGDAGAGTSAVPSHVPAQGSDNGGQLAGSDVPGGRNHAPTEAPAAQPFSGPIKKD